MVTKKTIILGVDPGFARTGYGVISAEGNRLQHLGHGCIETKCGEDFSDRIRFLSLELKRIIKEYKPDLVCVEELFFCTNVTTAIKVGQARGVILLSIIEAGLPILEFTPLQVKQAVSGYGKADKKQVQRMVQVILGMKEIPRPDDAADALAVAIAGSSSHKLLIQKKSKI